MEGAMDLRQCISQTIRTTARDALALLYSKLLSGSHPGKTPYELLNSNNWTRTLLLRNPQLKQRVKENDVDKMDVSALCILLRYCCGLSSGNKAWKDLSRLEGNIQKLKELRNNDAHRTQESCPKEDLEDTWTQLVSAITNILQLGGFDSHLADTKQQLMAARELIQEASPERELKMHSPTNTMRVLKMIRDELLESYKGRRKTMLTPIVWGGMNFSFHHHVEETYTQTKLTLLNDSTAVSMDGDNLLENFGSSRMIILQGDSGTGKTSLLRHYAAAWASHTSSSIPALAHVQYLVLLDCTTVASRSLTPFDIIQEILPNTYSTVRPRTILKELSKAEDKVMFLIDAFDERLNDFMSAFKNLQRKCLKARFVVTTRPHCTPAITKVCEEETVVVTAHGFSRSSALDFATKLFEVNQSNDVMKFFSVISPYEELIAIPQLLCWSSWFWMNNCSEYFSTRGKVFANVTNFLLRKLCHINGKRVIAGELPKEGQRWLSDVARVAFIQAKRIHISLSESSSEIKELIKSAEELKLRPLEAISTLMQCDSHMTGLGEHNVFQFVHDSHANFLAASHIAETLRSRKKVSLKNHFEDLQKDRKKSIIIFLVSLLFEKQENVNALMIQDIATLSQAYVNFYDINFILELIEESSYNPALIKALAKNISGNPNRNSNPLSTSTNSTASFLFNGQLWLRPKELRRATALHLLLSQAKPQRLCLRLCDGPHADELTTVRGHQVVEGDAAAAMRLVSRAYGEYHLPDLRLTDVSISTPLSWPKSLWWLSLERCHIKTDLHLPPGLLKVTLLDCTGQEHITFPSSLKSVKFQSMNLEEPRLPVNVETLVMQECKVKNLAFLSLSLKHLKIKHCIMPEKLCFPYEYYLGHSLSSGISSDLKRQNSKNIVSALVQVAASLRHLQSLSITGIALSPEAFINFFLEHVERNPRVRLQVESVCKLKEGEEAELIKALVRASRLPATVKFGDDVIINNAGADECQFG